MISSQNLSDLKENGDRVTVPQITLVAPMSLCNSRRLNVIGTKLNTVNYGSAIFCSNWA